MPSVLAHEDLHAGGLYTQSERKAWQQLLSFPHFHQALLKSISWGSCVQKGVCQPEQMDNSGVRSYDLERLVPNLAPLNPLDAIRKWIRTNGDYLALACILGLALKMVIDLAILMITMYQEGPSAVLALLILMMCNSRNSYWKIRRRNRRQQEGPPDEEAEGVPLRAPPPRSPPAASPAAGYQTPSRGTLLALH